MTEDDRPTKRQKEAGKEPSALWNVVVKGKRKKQLEGTVSASEVKNAYRASGIFDAETKKLLKGFVYFPPEVPAFRFDMDHSTWSSAELPLEKDAATVYLVQDGGIWAVAHLAGDDYKQENVACLFSDKIYHAHVETKSIEGCTGASRFDDYVGSLNKCYFTGRGRLVNHDGKRVEEGMFVAGDLHGNACKVIRPDDGIVRVGRYSKGKLAHGTIAIPRGEDEPILWVHGDVERRGSGEEFHEVIRGIAGSGVQGDYRVGVFRLENNVFSEMGATTYMSREFVEASRKWRRRKGIIDEIKCTERRLATINVWHRAPTPDRYYYVYRFIGVETFEGSGEVVSRSVREEIDETRTYSKRIQTTKVLQGDDRETRLKELNEMKMPTACGMGDCRAALAAVSAGAKAFDDDHTRVPDQ